MNCQRGLPRAHEVAARRAATRTTQSAQRTLCQRGLPLPSQQQGQELAGAPIKTALNADDEHLCVPKQPKLSAHRGACVEKAMQRTGQRHTRQP